MESVSLEKMRGPKSKPDPEECLYHSDPASFLSVMKEIGRTLLIPSSLLKRSAMAVCSCRTSRTSSQRMSVAELQVLLASCEITDEILLSCLTRETSDYSNVMTIQFVKKALRETRTHGRESHVRFAVLLKNAFKQDFNILQKESESGGRHTHEAKKPQRKAAPPHVMIRKQKKKIGRHRVLILPMFGGNSRLLQSEDGIGDKFAKLSVQYKPCVVEIDYEATGAAMKRNLQRTVVNIWCNQEKYRSIQNHLIASAQTLQRRITHTFEEQLRAIKLHKQTKRLYSQPANIKPNLSLARVADPELIREIKREDFSKKDRADKQNKTKLKHKKEDISVKCIQCHSTFTKVSTDQEEPTGRSPRDMASENDLALSTCRHHPGFLMKNDKQWSCCGQSTPISLQQADITTIHGMSGCSIDHSHVWRYNRVKKTNKKSKISRNDHACSSL